MVSGATVSRTPGMAQSNRQGTEGKHQATQKPWHTASGGILRACTQNALAAAARRITSACHDIAPTAMNLGRVARLHKESQEWGARHGVLSIGHQFPYLCVSFLSRI